MKAAMCIHRQATYQDFNGELAFWYRGIARVPKNRLDEQSGIDNITTR